MKINKMTVDKEHTKISAQDWKMWVEGTSIDDIQPKKEDIKKLLELENFEAYDIDIWYDNMQKLWRWNCDIINK